MAEKRAKLFMKTPNPRYMLWLEEWLLLATKRDQSNRIREITLAIESLKKFPVRLNSAKECIILENFSKQLVNEMEVRERLECNGNESVLRGASWSPAKSGNSTNRVSSPVSKRKGSPIKADSKKASPPKKAKFSPPESLSQNPIRPSLHCAPSPSKVYKKSSPAKASNSKSPVRNASQTYSSCLPSFPDTAWDDESHQNQLSLVQDLVAPSKTAQKSRKKGNHSQDTGEAVDKEQAVPLDETIIFPPNSFEVILLIDTAEKGFLASVAEFSDPEFRYEVRHLKVGDYAWIARGPAQKELLLPFLVERKRLDDLSKSVKDGRFSEQKFRLKMSNIPNIIYLIEDHSVRGNTGSITQGISNMLIKDAFTVKETRNNLESMRYLSNMSAYLSSSMAGKTLVSSAEYDRDMDDDIVRLPEVGFFFAGMGKIRTFTSKEMFTKQLVQLHGLSADKAWAIVSKYPTPKALIEAFKESGSSLLSDLTCGLLNRKLGQNISSVLYKFYTSLDFD